MKLRQYFQNVSLLFIINIAIKPIWVFGVERKFQLLLGKEAYGKYFSFLSSVMILSVLLDLGLHSYTVKLISEKKEDYKKFTSELWVSKWILVGLYTLAVILFIVFQRLEVESALIYALISLEVLCFSLFQFLRSFSQGLHLHRLDSLLSSLDRIILIIFGASILYLYSDIGGLSLEGFVGFHIVSYLICFIAVYYYLKNEISYSWDMVSSKLLKEIVRTGYLLLIVYVLMNVYSRIGPVMVQKILPNGDLECGILAYANAIIDSAYNALSLLAVFLLPVVASHYVDRNYGLIRKFVLYSFGIATIGSIVFISLCFYFSDWIYDRLYHTTDSYIIDVMRVQLWSVLGVSWMYVFGSYLTAIGKFKQLIVIVSIGVLVCLGFNYYLIPVYKGLGYALTNLIVQLTMGIMHMIVAIYYLFQDKFIKSNS